MALALSLLGVIYGMWPSLLLAPWELEWSKPAGSRAQWAARLLFKHTEHKRISLLFTP